MQHRRPTQRGIRSLGTVLLAVLLLAPPSARAKELNPVNDVLAARLAEKRVCIAVAVDVGERLLERATKTEAGLTFGSGSKVYDGDAGVALLFAGLYRATKDARWLTATKATLAQAVAALPKDPGFYTGRAGVGEACVEAFWATGDRSFLTKAHACTAANAKHTGTDIIVGAAGVGIFLLNLHRATGKREYLRQARDAGDYLVDAAVRKGGTAHWTMSPGKAGRVYLGFSHGAAGIGYFLLHLGTRTKHAPYLRLAEEAARFVLAHEDHEGEERAHWWRTVPKSSDYRRIQWCHGAPGIGLFFHDLHHKLKKAPYTEAFERCLTTTRTRGRNARAGGSQCHGVAGNAELFLEAYRSGGEAAWLREARASGSALLVADGEALRVKAGYGRATYDASYMLGLAGIGHFFLRLADPARTPLPMMVQRDTKPRR